ncbi:MAG: phosphopantetheinyl transferase, partial [Roseovarius sp.]
MSVMVATTREADLAQRIAALFPVEVSVATADPTAEPATPLFHSESAAVEKACDRRKREFHAGRTAAHRAMQLMGEPPAPVPAAANRAPLWPSHLTGSISHSETLCAAVLANTRATPALG